MAGPSLFRVLVEVTDLPRASAFYTSLLGISGRSVQGGRYYLECGPVIVALLDVALDNRAPRPVPEALYFAVSDLDAYFARAQAMRCLATDDVHGAPAGEIAVRPWGERSFYARDPFGNALCFVDDGTVFTGR
jgi:catechol 2,3-dioxygenase-like lactoylglutathione lyase family enzyme